MILCVSQDILQNQEVMVNAQTTFKALYELETVSAVHVPKYHSAYVTDEVRKQHSKPRVSKLQKWKTGGDKLPVDTSNQKQPKI